MFQPVDLRWGLSDAGTALEPSSTELKLQYIAECQTMSLGPNVAVGTVRSSIKIKMYAIATVISLVTKHKVTNVIYVHVTVHCGQKCGITLKTVLCNFESSLVRWYEIPWGGSV